MQFEMVTGGQFKEAVDRLEDQGMEQLIVDLRGNPGGVLDAAVEMLAYILPEDRMDGMLIYTADKDGKGDRYFCRDGKIVMESDSGYVTAGYPMEDGHQLDLPLAVLVTEVPPARRRCLPARLWIMTRASWWEPRPLEKALSRAWCRWRRNSGEADHGPLLHAQRV